MLHGNLQASRCNTASSAAHATQQQQLNPEKQHATHLFMTFTCTPISINSTRAEANSGTPVKLSPVTSSSTFPIMHSVTCCLVHDIACPKKYLHFMSGPESPHDIIKCLTTTLHSSCKALDHNKHLNSVSLPVQCVCYCHNSMHQAQCLHPACPWCVQVARFKRDAEKSKFAAGWKVSMERSSASILLQYPRMLSEWLLPFL